MTDSISEYLRLEYTNCHTKLGQAVEQLVRIELYIFLGVSALYAWFFGLITGEKTPPDTIHYALWLPPLLCCLAWYRSTMQLKYIASIAEYISLLESRMCDGHEDALRWKEVGWETWFKKHGPSTWNRLYRFILWPGLVIGTAVIAIYRVGLS